ncbi:MAG: EAL domain-containing protein, partial [Rhizobiales bacterium]|nr:EAL domain-containing protein [Hyphomicrobiales bacterium]
EVIGTMLAEAGVGPQSLEIEITEGQLLDGSEQTLAAVGRIRDLGVGISIDDFGAGHASFQYLRRFPVDQLKLDQMFVRQLVTTSSDAVIVRAIASLGRNLGLELVAEGVETRQQRDFLRQQGYALGQGYFFSPPVPAEAFARMLASGAPLPLAAVEPGAGRPGA